VVSRGLPWSPVVSRGLPWSPVVSRGLPWSLPWSPPWSLPWSLPWSHETTDVNYVPILYTGNLGSCTSLQLIEIVKNNCNCRSHRHVPERALCTVLWRGAGHLSFGRGTRHFPSRSILVTSTIVAVVSCRESEWSVTRSRGFSCFAGSKCTSGRGGREPGFAPGR